MPHAGSLRWLTADSAPAGSARSARRKRARWQPTTGTWPTPRSDPLGRTAYRSLTPPCAGVNLGNKRLVGTPETTLQRQVVCVEQQEQQERNTGKEQQVGSALPSHEDQHGGDQGDAPRFARAAVVGHPLDDPLQDGEMRPDGGRFRVQGLCGRPWVQLSSRLSSGSSLVALAKSSSAPIVFPNASLAFPRLL